MLSLLCSFFEILAPEGIGGGLKKHIRLVASLCVFCFSIAPICNFISELKDGGSSLDEIGAERDEMEMNYDEIYNANLSAETADVLERRCCALLCEEFSAEEGIDVEIILSKEFNVEYAALLVYPSAVLLDPRPMSERLSEMLGCECRIIYQ